MEDYKKEFIRFMIESGALQFGDFTLKSGRKSPFFMNSGAYVTGRQLKQLGKFYAKAANASFGLDYDLVFGPAYKGIPLSVITAESIYDLFDREVCYCSNRKEAKDHGDVGSFLGRVPRAGDKVLIVEDVTTSGKSIDETYPLLTQAADVDVVGLLVSLNRQEYGHSKETTALEEVSERYGFPASAIVTMEEVVKFVTEDSLTNKDGEPVISAMTLARIEDYYEEYGVR